MASKKDPAFLFYPSDFIMGTLTMNDDQVGKYIRLLCLQHSKGGKISEKDILKITIDYDQDIFEKFEQDEDGLFFNTRLLEEMTKRKEYSESRRKNKVGKTYHEDMKNICESHDEHMENTNTNINENINVFENEVKNKEVKHKYGEYKHVLLLDSEYDKLKADFTNADELIKYLDEYMEMKAVKYKSCNLAIRKWVVDAVNERSKKGASNGKDKKSSGEWGDIGTVL